MQKVILRADGSSQIGMGHFMRTLALGEMLKDAFHCIYATRTPNEYQVKEMTSVCKEHISLPGDDNHFQAFLSYLKGDEIVVLDNYFYTTAYQQEIRKKGCKLVCIDDIHEHYFSADVIINHNPAIRESDYQRDSSAKLFLGSDYALLRSAFLEKAAAGTAMRPLSEIMILIGGADPLDITRKAALACLGNSSVQTLHIITGNSYAHPLDWTKDDSRIRFYRNLSTHDLIEVMKSSGLAIVPASTVAFETLCIGMKVACGYFVPNQESFYHYLANNRFVYGLGDLTSGTINISSIFSSIENKSFTFTGRKLVDGRQKERFLSIFKEI